MVALVIVDTVVADIVVALAAGIVAASAVVAAGNWHCFHEQLWQVAVSLDWAACSCGFHACCSPYYSVVLHSTDDLGLVWGSIHCDDHLVRRIRGCGNSDSSQSVSPDCVCSAVVAVHRIVVVVANFVVDCSDSYCGGCCWSNSHTVVAASPAVVVAALPSSSVEWLAGCLSW